MVIVESSDKIFLCNDECKEIATHSSILAWEIPWTEELGVVLQSLGSQRVGHD